MWERSVKELAETIQAKAAEWMAAEEGPDKANAELEIGEEIFTSIFSEDTAILEAWLVKTKGKRKEPKFVEFKKRWDKLSSTKDLGPATGELVTWYRSVAVKKLIASAGLDADKLSWSQLNQLQQLKRVDRMVEHAKKAITHELTEEEPNVAQVEEDVNYSQTGEDMEDIQSELSQEETMPEITTAGSDFTEAPERGEDAAPASEPESEYPTVAQIAKLIQDPVALFESGARVDFIASPDNFKSLTLTEKDQLWAEVKEMANKLETMAKGYRNFEAVLRWSRLLK
jgi:hypothetical protein